MSPGIRTGEIPPFHKLNEYEFEELCRDLLDKEPNIATCDTYGVRGEAQEGIDLLAYRNEGDGIEVGQCKCYTNFQPAKIREASEKFFESWENHWSKKNVKRFILFVASELSTRKQQNEIAEQKERFAKVGVIYEAWSGATILNKLRPHRGIVAMYLSPSDYWVPIICGTIPSTSPWLNENAKQTTAIVDSALLSQFTTYFSADTQKKLDSMRVVFHEGRTTEIREWLQGIKANQTLWTNLATNVKAELLCFEANLVLHEPDSLNNVKQLVDESKQLAHSDNQTRLQALISYMEGEPERAIKQLEGQNNIESLNLKATFWLNMGKIDECQKLLQFDNVSIEPNAETFRIRALSYFLTKNLSQAHLEIQKALELKPCWYSIRFAAAIINYFSALSPAALPEQLVPWPKPVDWGLIKRDDTSFTYLRKAEKIFQELIDNTEIYEIQYLEAWRLACLANDYERQQEAIQYCKTILKANPSHYLAIYWANERHFKVNFKPSEKALKTLVAHKKATTLHILALISCYILSKNIKKAIHLLKETESIFQQEQTTTLWHFWHIRLLVLDGKPESAIKAIESSTFQSTEECRYAKSLALRAIAKRNDDWQALVQHLEDSYTNDPIFLIECCDLMAQQQNWDYIADHAKQLIEEIGTSEALRLAIIGTYNAKRYARCLDLLNEYQGFFKQRKLPNQLRQLKISCQCLLGILSEGVNEAEELAHDKPTTQNLILLAEAYFSKGDLKNLAIVARKLLDCSDLSTEQLLRIAHWVRLEDQQLAQFFWKRVKNQTITDEYVMTAYILGHQLGLEGELETLATRMMQLGHEERCGIQALTFDDTISLIKQQREHQEKIFDIYQNGETPIHIIVEEINELLVTFYHDILQTNEKKPSPKNQFALLARHGGRVLSDGFPKNLPKWRLNLDITAVLLAAHLEILSDVEKVFQPLRIPAELMPALLLMLDKINHHQPARLQTSQEFTKLQAEQRRRDIEHWLNNLINQLRQGIDNGTYEIIPSLTKKANGTHSEAFNFEGLKNLLSLKAHENDVVWVDDRYINGYYFQDGNIPIIGINEILKALVAAKSITISQYYAKISQLRAANVRYIPIEKDEILYHLQQAKIENNEILETQELSILRRYIAACLLRPHKPENSSNQNGEIAFLFSSENAITTALVDLWTTEKDENSRQIRAEWLVTSLYIDHIALFKVTSMPISNQDALYLLAISLSKLLFVAMSFQPLLNTDEIPMRRQYFEWVFTRILQKRFEANNNLLTTLADSLKKVLLSILEDNKIKPKEIKTLLIKKFYQDLPKPIQKEIERDTHFMAIIGLSSISAITVGDLSFKSEDFFRAANEAINGSQATIVELKNNQSVTFKPLEGYYGKQIFYNHPVTGDKEIIAGGLEILLESPAKREAALRKNRHWFDCSDETFNQAIAEIASIEDSQQRLEKTESWRNSSAAVYYVGLHQNLSTQGNFQFSDLLPPSVNGLLRHFRITPQMAKEAKFSDIFATIAQQLLEEEKLMTTMERIIALPVPIPIILRDAVAKLSSEEKRAIVKKYLKTNSTPLSKINFVHLLFSDETKAYQRLARRIVKNIFSKQGTQEIESFLSFLRWINEKLSHWLRDCSPSIRLAMVWAHAHRLFNIFMSLGVPVDWIQKTFNQAIQHIPPELFQREFEYRFDIAHPALVSQITFLMAGIAYSIGDKSIDENLQNIFMTAAFIENEGERFPNPLLLRDSTQACNGLGSFLGGHFGEKLAPLLGDENVKTFTPSFLEEALNKLAETSDDLSAWLQLFVVFGNLPANENFVDRLKAIILQTDFTKLLEQDVLRGNFVMHMTSLQISHFQHEKSRLYLKEQFLNNVKFIEKGLAQTKEILLSSLIESAFNISIAIQPADKAVAEFVELVTQLIETCHSLIPMCKPIIQRFCEELPVSQAQQFWPLLVRLRTESINAEETSDFDTVIDESYHR